MTVLETLKAARTKIAEPEHWTQGNNAKTVSGDPVSPLDKNATCWCSIGALSAVAGYTPYRAIDSLESFIPTSSISYFNDTHTHGEVLSLFDKAIANLEATHE